MRDEVPSRGTNIAIENPDFIMVNTIKNGGYFHGYVAMLVYRSVFFPVKPKIQSSNEQNPGCLGCIGDYTTQLYGDFNKPI